MTNLRCPAVPLITVDPFFSIWSCEDNLCDDVTRHWTGRRHNMLGLLRVDGKLFRFMGKANVDNRYRTEPTAMKQTKKQVFPMRTVYTFENDLVRIHLTFMSPLLLDDLKLMSRPVAYISYEVEALDGREHEVKLYFGMDCEICINRPTQEVTADVCENGVYCTHGEEEMLVRSGDDHNIEWGSLHLFSPFGFKPGVHSFKQLRRDCYGRRTDPNFRREFPMPDINPGDTFKLDDKVVYIYLEKDFTLGAEGEKGFICAAYDDIHSIMYFGRPIDAYYKKDGDTFADICKKAVEEYDEICGRVEAAEQSLMKEAKKISDKYCDIVSLVYRQVIAAHKLTWDGEEIQFLSKECFSNGCIGTLDVTYPSIPLFLLKNPTLVEGMLNPLFKYARMEAWPYDFAPHDVGRYPIANGQVYGLDENGNHRYEKQMPVEECGNAILCVYTICHYKKDNAYFIKNKDILEKWVKYLIQFGLDPENQLCTDDFAGHLAHNCNLSAKAIMGIAAYAKLLENTGDAEAENYMKIAKEYAQNWENTAFDKDHYKLTFDGENTWSIKYNMVWDKMFGWGIFSDEVFEREVAYYSKKINKYGLPLDSRSDYTKSDWQMWSVMLTDNEEYRNKIIDTMWDMLNESPDRVPFTDWYYTSTAQQCTFQNRTVQGGLYFPLLK